MSVFDSIIMLGYIVSVVTGDHDIPDLPNLPENTFSVSKLLDYHPETEKTYWLAPKRKKEVEFVLDLGCKKAVNIVELVNTPKDNPEDRSMGEFKVSLSDSSDGPWEEVVGWTLEDSRKETDHLPVKKFPFKEKKATFVKFNQISYYGYGGGLQYFAVNLRKSGDRLLSSVN